MTRKRDALDGTTGRSNPSAWSLFLSTTRGKIVAAGSLVLLIFMTWLAAVVMPYMGRTKLESMPAVSVVPYNFTKYGIDYRIGERWGGSVQPGEANGHGVLLYAYVPGESGAPMIISWRYVTGEYQGKYQEGSQEYMYTVTLPEPSRKVSDNTLMIRFYPDGKVAVRYTDEPDYSDLENISPRLNKSDWETNQQ